MERQAVTQRCTEVGGLTVGTAELEQYWLTCSVNQNEPHHLVNGEVQHVDVHVGAATPRSVIVHTLQCYLQFVNRLDQLGATEAALGYELSAAITERAVTNDRPEGSNQT